MGIKHTFLSPKADGPDATVVRPSDWNANHIIGDGTMVLDAASGVGTFALGSLTALTLGTSNAALTDDGGTLAHVFDVGSNDYNALVVSGSAAGFGGPQILLDHNSASPAGGDDVGALVFYGKDSAANQQFYGQIVCTIDDPTSTSEDGRLRFFVQSAGSPLNALTLGSGAQVGSPTGGDKGAGTVNATNYYTSGVKLPAPLGASLTLYVGPGGSDSNPGTALLPFRTILGAWIYILNNIFPSGQQITIQLQNGTYDLSVLANFGFLIAPIATLAYDRILIQGDTTTPSNVTLDVKGGVGIFCGGGVQLDVRGVHFVDTAGGGIFLRAEGAGSFIGFGQCDFGAGAGIQCFAASAAEIICNATSYTISGGGAWHLYSQANGVVDVENNNITITGTPNFTGGFIQAIDGGLANYVGNTITGTATGPRFSAAAGGVVAGNSLTSIPGDSAGNVQGGTFHFVETYITRLPIAFSASPFGTAPYEGQIQAFTDSSTAVWGDVITNGGGNHVLGYYNGTNWTVMAK